MKRKIFKKILLFALTMLFFDIAFAQTASNESRPSKMKIGLSNIGAELSEVLRTVSVELKKIDFENIAVAIESAGHQVDKELSNIEIDIPVIIINPDSPEDSGSTELVGTAEKTRIITKSYSVDSKDKLSINNQYGKVAIHTWAKKEIKVEIEIKAYEASESSAEKLLESVNIEELKDGNLISFKTNFEKTSSNFWSKIKNGNEERRGVQVNYEIYMPSTNPLDISNRYGKTELDDFSGPVNISSSYGSFSAGKLNHPANQVKVSYGSASIENFINGTLSVAYGSLKMEQAAKLDATIKYGSASIGQLTQGGNFKLSYTGGFKIEEVDSSVKNLTINSSYSGVTLGLKNGADFDFDVTVNYAGFNYDRTRTNLSEQLNSNLNDNKSKSWSPTKNYKGQIGKGSDSMIIIKSNYGGVKFL